MVEAFEQGIKFVDRVLADPRAVVTLLHLVEFFAEQMHIPVEITVEHQNDGQADDQDDDNTGCEHLLVAVQRIQEITIRVYVTR